MTEENLLFVTAAKSIQTFIMRTNKLKHIVGASELVDSLTRSGGFLDEVIAALGIPDSRIEHLVRAAGSARLLMQPEDAQKLALVWPLACSLYAPGLEMTQAVLPKGASLSAALEEAEHQLRRRRSFPSPRLPIAGPLVRRVPRDGMAATGLTRTPDGTREFVSAEMNRKLQSSPAKQVELLAGIIDPSDLEKLRGKWPIDFEEISGPERDYLAVIHADGNGLGKVIMELLGKKTIDYKALSEAIGNATRVSLRTAFGPVIKEVLAGNAEKVPFRLLVCAGDDVTVVLRADLAIDFTRSFLESFETETRNALSRHGHADGLTACAGIAFTKRNYPFSDAYALAESLCKRAKVSVERRASALAFWRQTASSARSYDDVEKYELTVGDRLLSMGAYFVGNTMDPASGVPALDSLLDIVDAIDPCNLPRGATRGLVSELTRSPASAMRAYERMQQVQDQVKMETLENALEKITGSADGPLWATAVGGGRALWRTPFMDALELQAIGRRSGMKATKGKEDQHASS